MTATVTLMTATGKIRLMFMFCLLFGILKKSVRSPQPGPPMLMPVRVGRRAVGGSKNDIIEQHQTGDVPFPTAVKYMM